MVSHFLEVSTEPYHSLKCEQQHGGAHIAHGFR